MTNTTEPQTATERAIRDDPKHRTSNFGTGYSDVDMHRRFLAMTTDQTPDAVRAAIAEALDDAFADTIDAYVANDETANAYLRGDLIRTVFTVLDQIGALRVVGEGVSKAQLRAAVERVRETSITFGKKWPEITAISPHLKERRDAERTLDALIDRLPIPDAAARAGDGAT